MLLFVYLKNSSSVCYIVVIFAPYQILILCRPHHNENAHYSRTSRKRPHKMRRGSGPLQEVVAYESRIAGGLVRVEGRTHLLFGENVLHAIFTLQYTYICKSMLFLKVLLIHAL